MWNIGCVLFIICSCVCVMCAALLSRQNQNYDSHLSCVFRVGYSLFCSYPGVPFASSFTSVLNDGSNVCCCELQTVLSLKKLGALLPSSVWALLDYILRSVKVKTFIFFFETERKHVIIKNMKHIISVSAFRLPGCEWTHWTSPTRNKNKKTKVVSQNEKLS